MSRAGLNRSPSFSGASASAGALRPIDHNKPILLIAAQGVEDPNAAEQEYGDKA